MFRGVELVWINSFVSSDTNEKLAAVHTKEIFSLAFDQDTMLVGPWQGTAFSPRTSNIFPKVQNEHFLFVLCIARLFYTSLTLEFGFGIKLNLVGRIGAAVVGVKELASLICLSRSCNFE